MFVWTMLFVVEVLPWLVLGIAVSLGFRFLWAAIKKLEQ